MIDLRFTLGSQIVAVRIIGKQVFFSHVHGNYVRFADVSGLKLSVGGILKQFPDLEGKSNEEVRKEGVRRFKEHIKTLPDEYAIVSYLKEDLAKHGYTLKLIIPKGFRPKPVK
mgnify:CR=1 FL=1|jgi:hypothetical protein|tara:strand:- start:4969 stop:5307 length:339 start_codon:yes stop_codon:yes gene_type:complete